MSLRPVEDIYYEDIWDLMRSVFRANPNYQSDSDDIILCFHITSVKFPSKVYNTLKYLAQV